MKLKHTKTDILRSWGFAGNPQVLKTGYTYFRYTNPIEKGIFWYYFSLWIRQRDVEKYGTCISCGRPITVESSQAGHFMPAKDCGLHLLFHEQNVNAECSQCNAWDETHLLGYAENLDKRYGSGTATKLRLMRDVYKASKVPVKDLKGAQYAQMIRDLPTFTAKVMV